MPRTLLMGVDIGTSESKGVLCTPQGEIVAVHKERHGMETPRPGWFEQDPEAVWWGDFVKISRSLVDQSAGVGRVEAVSVSGLGQDLIPVTKDCVPTRRTAILYGIDTRAEREMEEMTRALGVEEILAKSYSAISTHSVGPKLLWLKKNDPEAYAKADYFLTASSYLTAKLTGRFVLDHHQASFWVPLYDFEGRRWNEAFCKGLVETERLPELRWEYEPAGAVTPEAARVTGLAQGTTVCVGTGDAFAESLSAGALEPGEAMAMLGSTTCIYLPVAQPRPDKHLWTYQSYAPGSYGVCMCTAASGSVTKWFKNLFMGELPEDEAYGLLTGEAAEAPPGAGGVVLLPYFSGERSPLFDPSAKGQLYGLSLGTTRGELYRAILEGVGYSVRHNLEELGRAGETVERMTAVGGGTRNPVWLQAVSDICGITLRVPRVTLGASYGDAFLAGLGAGLFRRVEEIRGWVTDGGTIRPREEYRTTYDSGYQKYRELYENNKHL